MGSVSARPEEAIRFLQFLFPDGPWKVTAMLDGKTKKIETRTFTPGEENVLKGWAGQLNDAGWNIYYQPAMWDRRTDRAKKVSKSDILFLSVHWADFDSGPESVEECVKLLAEGDLFKAHGFPLPAAIVKSGNGVWPYVARAEPIEDLAEAEAINKALVDMLVGLPKDPTAKGADSGQNADRIARLPGFVNHPDAKKRAKGYGPQLATWVRLTPEAIRHPSDDFKSFARSRPGGTPKTAEGATGANGLTSPPGSVPVVDHPLLQPGDGSFRPCGDAFEDLEKWPVDSRAKRLIAGGTAELDEAEKARKTKAGADLSGSGYAWEVYCALARARVPFDVAVGVLFCPDYAIARYMEDRKETPEKLLKHDFPRAVERVGTNAPFRSEDAPAEAMPKGKSPPFVRDKNGVPVAKQQRNIRLAIDALGVRVRYDQFADRSLIEGLDGLGPWLDDAALNRLWLAIDERFGMLPPNNFFLTVVSDYARRNAFHPVRDYLARVEPEWDRRPRIDRWLIDYGGAEDTEFNRAVGALTLLAAVRRIRSPGAKFDEMLVLEGAQGVGKSSAIEALMPEPQWFSDNFSFSNRDREVLESLAGRWIIEAPELKGMRKSDAEARKAFMSRRTDCGRLAYARTVSEVPRCCVFIGTTNDDRYLTDPTGNRRFWPVAVTGFDLAAIRRDRDQLWAEAATREATGASIRLDPRLYHEAARSQQARRVEDPWGRLIADALGGLAGKIDPVRLWDIVGVEKARRTQADNDRLGTIMRDLGWDRKKRRLRGFKTTRWAYVKGESTEEKGQEIFVQWEGGDAFATRELPF